MFDLKTFKPEAVILCAGEYPSNEVPLRILEGAEFLCCCDGAATSLIDRGIIPQAIVGDGDSFSPQFREQYKDILHIITEQDDNDQTKATRFCIARGFNKMAYLGATGRREDHTLGNISLMVNYLRTLKIKPVMFTDYGAFIPCEGEVCLKSFTRQQVSVFNMTCRRLESKGLKWPARATDELWQGTLNEATGSTVTLSGDGVFLVYMTYKPKTTEPETTLLNP